MPISGERTRDCFPSSSCVCSSLISSSTELRKRPLNFNLNKRDAIHSKTAKFTILIYLLISANSDRRSTNLVVCTFSISWNAWEISVQRLCVFLSETKIQICFVGNLLNVRSLRTQFRWLFSFPLGSRVDIEHLKWENFIEIVFHTQTNTRVRKKWQVFATTACGVRVYGTNAFTEKRKQQQRTRGERKRERVSKANTHTQHIHWPNK